MYISRQVECLQYKSRLAECLHDMSRQAEYLHVSPSSKRSPLAQLSHLSFGEIHPESFIDKYDCFFINNLLTNVPNLILLIFIDCFQSFPFSDPIDVNLLQM